MKESTHFQSSRSTFKPASFFFFHEICNLLAVVDAVVIVGGGVFIVAGFDVVVGVDDAFAKLVCVDVIFDAAAVAVFIVVVTYAVAIVVVYMLSQ